MSSDIDHTEDIYGLISGGYESFLGGLATDADDELVGSDGEPLSDESDSSDDTPRHVVHTANDVKTLDNDVKTLDNEFVVSSKLLVEDPDDPEEEFVSVNKKTEKHKNKVLNIVNNKIRKSKDDVQDNVQDDEDRLSSSSESSEGETSSDESDSEPKKSFTYDLDVLGSADNPDNSLEASPYMNDVKDSHDVKDGGNDPELVPIADLVDSKLDNDAMIAAAVSMPDGAVDTSIEGGRDNQAAEVDNDLSPYLDPNYHNPEPVEESPFMTDLPPVQTGAADEPVISYDIIEESPFLKYNEPDLGVQSELRPDNIDVASAKPPKSSKSKHKKSKHGGRDTFQDVLAAYDI